MRVTTNQTVFISIALSPGCPSSFGVPLCLCNIRAVYTPTRAPTRRLLRRWRPLPDMAPQRCGGRTCYHKERVQQIFFIILQRCIVQRRHTPSGLFHNALGRRRVPLHGWPKAWIQIGLALSHHAQLQGAAFGDHLQGVLLSQIVQKRSVSGPAWERLATTFNGWTRACAGMEWHGFFAHRTKSAPALRRPSR